MSALLATLIIPAAGALVVALLGRWPNLRETASMVTAGLLFAAVVMLLRAFDDGVVVASVTLAEPFPGLPLQLDMEPLGLLFALVASGLWIVTTIYAIGYMRGNKESDQTRFFVCFAVSIAACMGIAFAGNMFTLFVFYEVLTLATYPLVTHKRNDAARRGGRMYLGILFTTSIAFLLLATLWTWHLAGTLDFEVGGILAGKAEPGVLSVLVILYMFGIGKAALMPFHRWLPSAMVAPTPVSALLHAVAVVKAGVFSVLKVSIYIFGIDTLQLIDGSMFVMWVAAFTILCASLVAMTKDNLKARLAYSTVSQLAYIVLAAMIATDMSIIGGSSHIAMHAMGKITLFFCAGAIYTAAHKTEISQMDGLGRVMPFTYLAFLIGSLSVIGLPPMGGSWSKWFMLLGAADSGLVAMMVVLMISSLLNIAYLLPIVVRGFFARGPDGAVLVSAEGHEQSGITRAGMHEAPLFCTVPLCLTAIGCIVLFFYADGLFALVGSIPVR